MQRSRISLLCTYAAPQSGYRLHLISQGSVELGVDLSRNTVARVQVCPLPGTKARSFKLSLSPSTWTVTNSPDHSSAPVELKINREDLLHLLKQTGYQKLVPTEAAGSLEVMESSLAGPKGVVLEEQINSVQVIDARIESSYAFN